MAKILTHQASAKRSQHFSTTYPNIVVQAFASPANHSNMWTQHIATLLGATLLRRAATFWVLKIKLEHTPRCNLDARTCPNDYIKQHPQDVATGWPNARNMLRPIMLRYVVLRCCDRLAGALDWTAKNDHHTLHEGTYFYWLRSSLPYPTLDFWSLPLLSLPNSTDRCFIMKRAKTDIQPYSTPLGIKCFLFRFISHWEITLARVQ